MDYASWEYDDASFLGGKAVDETGNYVQNWAHDMYTDLLTAQLACVALCDGCSGVTGHHQSNGYSVRRFSKFTTPGPGLNADAFSYLKPDKPCGRPFNQKI